LKETQRHTRLVPVWRNAIVRLGVLNVGIIINPDARTMVARLASQP